MPPIWLRRRSRLSRLSSKVTSYICTCNTHIVTDRIDLVKPPPAGKSEDMSKLRTANLLGALSGVVTERLVQRLKRHPNQTDSAAAALNVLTFWEGASNTELAKVLGLSHPATVRLVDRLEDAGLVEARPGRDKR